jgi:hypothetical protein
MSPFKGEHYATRDVELLEESPQLCGCSGPGGVLAGVPGEITHAATYTYGYCISSFMRTT